MRASSTPQNSPMLSLALAMLVVSESLTSASFINRQSKLATFKNGHLNTINPKPLSVAHTSARSTFLQVSRQEEDIANQGKNIENNGKVKKNELVEIMEHGQATEETRSKMPTKLLRLKDRMWVREALEDITAAEFACTLGGGSEADPSNGEEGKKKKTKRAVDFENILAKLERRLDDMCTRTTFKEAGKSNIVCYPLSGRTDATGPNEDCYSLEDNVGMASVTYTFEQRDALVVRILETRENLVTVMSGEEISTMSSTSGTDLDRIREKLQTERVETDESATKIDEEKAQDTPISSKTKSASPSTGDPYLYVRDDGTVDWDGALQDSRALKKFGTSVWARINGEDPGNVDEDAVEDGKFGVDGHGAKKPVTAKIADTDAIREKKARLDILTLQYNEMNEVHTALLSSAVEKGSTVANVNFATLDPELRLKIRLSSDNLGRKKDELSFQTLNYELERIYTYLDGELGNTATKGYIPLSDRLNVAEFGLLESQIEALNRQLANGDVVDSDVLSVVMDQTADFKRRLGIDYYVTGLTFDKEAIQIFLNELLTKSKNGLAFYGRGCQLFWNDLVFSSSLIGRALQGYTLKPREVRTLRRTFKDVITFIPVIIILIIPLSPVGHVLVFGAIQRVFPDFFPSCFTERRQNLLSLYETTEFSALTIDENWKEKIVRIFTATLFIIVNSVKSLAITDEKAKEDTKP